MADILEYTGTTILPISPQKMLAAISKDRTITNVVVLALHDGQFSAYSSSGDIHLDNYLCDVFKAKLFKDES